MTIQPQSTKIAMKLPIQVGIVPVNHFNTSYVEVSVEVASTQA